VIRRRLLPIALVVTGLLAVVAIVAGGRPLGSSHGKNSGLPASFWDYVFTTFVILDLLAILASFASLFVFRRDLPKRQSYQTRTARALAILLLIAVLAPFIARHIHLHQLFGPHRKPPANTRTGPGRHGKHRHLKPPPPRTVHFQWEELVAVLVLLIALGAVMAATRSRLRAGIPRSARAPEALAAALDESLDDLRSEPDLRAAIVAAYARMEAALAAAGLPRHDAEAPLEYLERALLSLDTSADAVRRLTDLFEWARFSQHEPEPSMRDEAVDALVAVRDELRASERVPT
jgi:hypothetical protein